MIALGAPPHDLRVLTVRQPWAWAIIHGGKDVENRVRSLGPYRGPVAIHVAGAYAVDGLDLPALNDARDAWCDSVDCDGTAHPWTSGVGHVIGVVDLVDVHHADQVTPTFCGICPEGCCGCSPWAMPDHHHLELANPRPLTTPIPARGRLGLWRPDPDLAAAILAALPKETIPDA